MTISPTTATRRERDTEISDPSVFALTPLVSVLVITYNHAPYIADAIEGVAAQKTAFPIELVIGEDCSTDETRSIVLDYQRRYPNLIRVISSDRNVGMQENYRRVHAAARGRYVAFCEGDDVWIDDRKLEKQAGIFASDPDCSMVFHAVKIVRVRKGTETIRRYGTCMKTFSLDEVLLAGGAFIFAGSTMVRRSLIDPIPGWVIDCEVGDYPFNVYCASRGTVVYMPDVMSVYRSGIPGSWGVRAGEFDLQKRTLDSILRMLDEFLRETGREAAEAVRKTKEKFVIYLYIRAKEYPSLSEQDRQRYESCLTWKGKAMVFLTRVAVLRRLVGWGFRLKNRGQRLLAGRKAPASIRSSRPKFAS